MTRREFVGRAAAGAALAAGVVPSAFSAMQQTKQASSPNDKVVLGLIACGGMGSSNMRTLMAFPDIEVAALCDVDTKRVAGDFAEVEKKYGRKPDVYSDYRKILDRKDIDAVIVGTPDHWHALNLIHACEAGKDVYCEKPISHNLVEARSMAAAAKRFNRIVQCGTWQRSTREFTDAIGYIRKGKLGKITQCRAWISDGTRIGKGKKEAVPSNLDFDFWIGPAKAFEYQPNLVHWNWRWVMNTGGGLTTDWGVHMMDIALLGMSKTQDLVMPTEVMALGGQYAILDDDRDAPDVTEALIKFNDPEFIMHWSVLRDHPGKPGHGTEFISSDGKTLRVWRGGWTILDPEGKEMEREQSEPVPTDHWRNWVDCIKTREKPRADLMSVAQTTAICHLVNMALYSGETVKWDNAKFDVKGNAGKNTLSYSRPYRKPWSLPIYKL